MAMRVGPLSNPKIIQFINGHFVPVFVSNEDVQAGKFGDAEQRALRGLRKNAQAKGLSSGTVHVYLMKPDLEVVDVMHVAKASNPHQLLRWLRDTAEQLQTTPGDVLIPPSATANPPSLKQSELLLHVRSQFNDKLASHVEDWVVLEESEWQQFVQSPKVAELREWNVDDDLAKKILIHLYPYASDWNLDVASFKDASIGLRVIKSKDGTRKLAISGKMERIQNLQPGKSPARLMVEIVGVVKIDNDGRPRISASTFKAKFGHRTFDGILNSIAAEDADSVERRVTEK